MKNKTSSFLNIRRWTVACLTILIITIPSCSSSRHTDSHKPTEIKNWLSWTIKFKRTISEDEKIRDLAEIEKRIFDYINKVDPSRNIILSAAFSYVWNFRNPETYVNMNVSLSVKTSTGAARIVVNGPKPKDESVKADYEVEMH